jgi:ABC-type transport system involved in cytochrome bd biosynthesis fused ATPase/permease subunit
MKRLILSVIVLLAGICAKAQIQTTASELAEKIAQRMKDSLSLSTEQKNGIYTINMQLHTQKQNYRQQYSNIDSLQYYIQRVESTRDSLYKIIIGQELYLQYKSRKRNLVRNN